MKTLVTEQEILKRIKDGEKKISLPAGAILTPLALDRIKTAGLMISNETTDSKSAVVKDSFINDSKQKSVAIGSDHTGFKTKELLIKYLKEKGFTIIDVGTYNENSCDYPDFASSVAQKIIKNDAHFGILLDATGIPSAITANKYKNIRAATCYNEFSAKSAREHNNSNVLVMGAKTLGEETIKSILDTFLQSGFLGERHQKRLSKIEQIEESNFK
ncbi:MAG TPA: ribose 5-phosphate isomerase B [Ignavibacteriaceae bacterium]|nr:ribose 5-phosphate isomerase B [Ignavibacteriaceae bacterium]